MEKNARGVLTGPGIFFVCMKLMVPLAYIYIALILLREVCAAFPETIHQPIERYLPPLGNIVSTMRKSSVFMEVWVVIEAMFYVCLKLHILWLQRKDPLEASLSAAPMLELHERRELWGRMMTCEAEDPVSFITGWYFDQDLGVISKHDVLEFCAWSMFEGRNLEHLTRAEMEQLHSFVDELEWRISLRLHGVASDNSSEEEFDKRGWPNTGNALQHPGDIMMPLLIETVIPENSEAPIVLSELQWSPLVKDRATPRKQFYFQECNHPDDPSFFSNLYENYKHRYEQYREMMENAEFHPVLGIRNFMAEKRQQIFEAEENALNAANQIYENAYFTVVDRGSNVDKQLTALSHATRTQLTEAWNSMCSMKERLETADFVATRQQALRQQLKGYRLLLDRMRSQATAVPAKQMATIMLKITQCNDAMERVEHSAREAFVKATGFAGKNLLVPLREPQRYAKYSHDPLLGLSTYPLMFHVFILGVTDGGLRFLMRRRGFELKKIGPISYYFHPGTLSTLKMHADGAESDPIPIVFCHGIGIGLIYYLDLIDNLLKTDRPLFLPEIPYVSCFRPWQSPNSILPPTTVASTLSAMLASHGYLRAAFMGHSYGTSWLSYMCKYAPSVLAAVFFLDPICFCLHYACLTKQFVYQRPDPGSVSFMVRTDVIINWTIQRSFPWARISLFIPEQIPDIPCAILLSEHDALVPAARVEKYLRSIGAVVKDIDASDSEHFLNSLNVTMVRGKGHGDWCESPPLVKKIAESAEIIFSNARKETFKTR